MARTLNLNLTLRDMETVTGEWCTSCLLPSAVKVTADMTAGGDTSIGTFERTWCLDCGATVE